MKNSKKDFNNAGQSVTEVKKSQKHDANLQKNSSLYFQIGLILCLLGTYSLFEMQFQEKKITFSGNDTAQSETISIDYVEPFRVEVIEQKKPEPLPSVDVIDVIKVVDNTTPDVKTIVKTSVEPKISDKPIVDVVSFEEPTEVVDEIHVNAVQFVPIFPGCEKFQLNSKRKKCLNEKVGKLVRKKFNTGIASDYGLSGIQKINVEFKVDKSGIVTDVRARAVHPKLEEEAKRIVNKIPKMKPGKMGTTPVNVVYSLPIKFLVH